MSGPVRNQTDYSKHASFRDPSASESKAGMSTAPPEQPNASGLGPRREYASTPQSSELPRASARLAERASKPSLAVSAARAKLEGKVTMSSVEGKLSSSAGDASVTAKFSSPVKIDVRDINGDGTTEICVETKAVGATIEICVPLDPSPPVAGARGASGDDRSAGAGGSGGS